MPVLPLTLGLHYPASSSARHAQHSRRASRQAPQPTLTTKREISLDRRVREYCIRKPRVILYPLSGDIGTRFFDIDSQDCDNDPQNCKHISITSHTADYCTPDRDIPFVRHSLQRKIGLSNPYVPPSEPKGQYAAMLDLVDAPGFVVKTLLIVLGIGLYVSTPIRDAYLYESMLQNNGLPPEGDSIAIGIAASFIAMIFLSPLAITFVGYGIGRATQGQVIPTFRRFTLAWGSFSTLLATLVIWIQFEIVRVALEFGPSWVAIFLSITYVIYTYVWWCYSISHKRQFSIDGEPRIEPKFARSSDLLNCQTRELG